MFYLLFSLSLSLCFFISRRCSCASRPVLVQMRLGEVCSRLSPVFSHDSSSVRRGRRSLAGAGDGCMWAKVVSPPFLLQTTLWHFKIGRPTERRRTEKLIPFQSVGRMCITPHFDFFRLLALISSNRINQTARICRTGWNGAARLVDPTGNQVRASFLLLFSFFLVEKKTVYMLSLDSVSSNWSRLFQSFGKMGRSFGKWGQFLPPLPCYKELRTTCCVI